MTNTDLNKEVPANVKQEEDGFDIKSFFAKLRASWWIFIVSLIVCGLLGLLFYHYKAPTYNIMAKVLIDDESSNASSDVTSSSSLIDLSSLLDIKSNVDNEVVVLMTRRLLAQTTVDMNLNVVYYLRRYVTDQQMNRNPFILKVLKPVDTVITTSFYIDRVDNNRYHISYKEIFPNGSSDKKDVTHGYDQPFYVAGVGLLNVFKNSMYGYGHESYKCVVENVDQRIFELQQLFTINTTSTTTTTISLVFNYPISDEGENILAHLIAKYQKQNVQLKNTVADSTIKFLNDQLLLTSRQLESIEITLQDFKQKNKLADLSAQGQLLLSTSNTYMEDLNKNETELSIIRSLDAYLKDETKNKTVVPVSVLPNDPEFAALVDQYNQLLIERDKQAISVTEDNPFMQNIQARIASLRAQMIKNLATTQQALQITNQQLKSTNGGFNNQIENIPPLQKEYLDLQRQQEIAQTLYTYLLQKKEESEISKTSNLSIATTIDDSKADFKPYSPNPILVAAVAIFVGLLYPVGRIFYKDLLNRKILVREDIVKNTSVPIIGEISHNKTDNNLVVLNGSRSAIAEQFRSLRTNLQFFINKENEKVILVTSSISGEGKSFTTINLAGVLAISGKKVLLMELDLRKPQLSNYFGIENVNGFSNYIISNNMSASSIIQHSTFHENLYIVSSGPVPPNPAELILDVRADNLIKELREQFDYIIIDAPPIGIVTDAQLMNRFSDMTLYVVRQNYTLKDQLKLVEELYQNKRMNKLALIVNDIEVRNGYGYGYNYGYGYGYGYGYYEDDSIKSPIKRFVKKITGKKK